MEIALLVIGILLLAAFGWAYLIYLSIMSKIELAIETGTKVVGFAKYFVSYYKKKRGLV